MTEVLSVNAERPEPAVIERAAAVLKAGGLVAFPTETVYGLGANALDERAVARIFAAKGRPADNPLIVHVAGRRMLYMVAEEVGEKAARLIEKFWPGPLTLIFRRRPEVAPSVSAGLATVAARMPENRIALEMIRQAGLPIAAPSANRSGRPSPTSARHVLEDLEGRVDLILDGGPARIGIESTVLDLTAEPPAILRPGWVTGDMLAEVIGPVEEAAGDERKRRSPGTRHRHYSPRARVVLLENRAPEFIHSFCTGLLKTSRVGFIGHTKIDIEDRGFAAVFLENTSTAYAASLYDALRRMDEWGAEVIVVEGISTAGAGAAVMDRLRRAASEIVAGEAR